MEKMFNEKNDWSVSHQSHGFIQIFSRLLNFERSAEEFLFAE